MFKNSIKNFLKIVGLRKNHSLLFERKFNHFQDMSKVKWVGTKYGGNFIPHELEIKQSDVSYLFGAGEDISFDCELASLYPGKVVIFDPTPRAIEHYQKFKDSVDKNVAYSINNGSETYNISKNDFQKITFLPFGVADENKVFKFYKPQNPEHVSCSIENLQNTSNFFEAECFTISQLMDKLSHTQLSLVKLNIEGAEYRVIDNMISENIFPKYLLVTFDEIHSPMDEEAENRILKCVESLKIHHMTPFFMYHQYAIFKNKNFA